jgi:hypothetical protein
VPQAAPISIYSLRAPSPSRQNQYDAASERNASAARLALIRSTTRQYCPADRPTGRRPVTMTPMKRLAFQHDAGDLVTRAASDAAQLLPSFAPRQPTCHTPPHISTAIGKAASPPTRLVADLYHGRFRSKARRRLRCDQTSGENAARSASAPLRDGAAVRRGLTQKRTMVAGMLGPSEANARTGRSFSLAGVGAHSGRRGV